MSSPLVARDDLLRERLRQAPMGAGVYLMRGADNEVLYVGKAGNLRNRLRQYFAKSAKHGFRIEQLVAHIHSFDMIPCLNESEALVLENLLIKRYWPLYNVMLKDDKNYLFLKIVKPEAVAELEGHPERSKLHPEAFPRPTYTRRTQHDGARYFGPYPSAQALRSTIRYLRPTFNFRTCSDETFKRGRVCLDYHIKRCQGPCQGFVSQQAYIDAQDELALFMDGKVSAIRTQLHHQMEEAASSMEYERAAKYRDRIRHIEHLSERQRVQTVHKGDHDCVSVARYGDNAIVAVMNVTNGTVNTVDWLDLRAAADCPDDEVYESFLSQYYAGSLHIPRHILLAERFDGADALEEILSTYRGAKVEIRVPKRGVYRDLLHKTASMAAVTLQQRSVDTKAEAPSVVEQALDGLRRSLHLEEPLHRIECYDISNTMGTNSVGSMIVFEDGVSQRKLYRIFSIKTVEGPNDFASMQEVLERRLSHLPARGEVTELPVSDPLGSNGAVARRERSRRRGDQEEEKEDESLSSWPDLIIIDGGKGQLSAVVEVLEAAGVTIPVVGLAKRNEEIYFPRDSEPLVLPKESPVLHLVQRIRDEAHRFAITNHRRRRGKAAIRSVLDDVAGIGPVRKKLLLARYGSIEDIRRASAAEIADVLHCGIDAASAIHSQI